MAMSLLSPNSLLWLFGHLCILLLGVVFVDGNIFGDYVRHDLAQGIGGSLIAAGIAGEILFLYIKASENTRTRLDLLIESGLLKVFPNRSVLIRDEYESRLKNAKEIDILGFGLSSFREDYGDKFHQLSIQAQVRIIVLDPDFPSASESLANIRDREEKNQPGQIKGDVEAFEKAVRQTLNLDRTRFQVKRLRAIPAINLFRIDNVIFWGPYLVGNQSRNMPTLIVQRGGFLFDQFKKHFDDLWTNEQLTIAAPI